MRWIGTDSELRAWIQSCLKALDMTPNAVFPCGENRNLVGKYLRGENKTITNASLNRVEQRFIGAAADKGVDLPTPGWLPQASEAVSQ